MEASQLSTICKEALHLAHRTLKTLKEKGCEEIHDAHVVDISTQGDIAVSEALITFFRKKKIPATVYSEESEKIELGKNPQYTITFDDIDGTDNYHRARQMLPHCTVVTIFDSKNPTFADALVAGIIEHNSETVWLATRGLGCFVNGVRMYTSLKKVLDRRTLVVIDHYASHKEIAQILRIYPQAWIKDFGSDALHLAGVANGIFDAYLCTVHKAHELGAGYLLIREAGGFIGDLKGKDFDKVPYDFNAKYSVIAAATKELAENIITKIK